MAAKKYLLDIEGTTTPIAFVRETLFPYSQRNLEAFLNDHRGELDAEIGELRREFAADPTVTGEFDALAYLRHLIDIDKKSTPLKSIQGKIWAGGYASGEIVAPIFPDVPTALERWLARSAESAIYSSGSVLAQKQLFAHTDHGDLTPLISNFFDTEVGSKRDATSYVSIAERLSLDAREICFVSDQIAELDAARSAGMHTALAMRLGNAEILEDITHRTIASFNELE